MSIYAPLNQHLLECGRELISMTFVELEQLLGFALPKSARKHRAWWANGTHAQARAWLDAGCKIEQVDLLTRTVIFSKNEAATKQKLQQQNKVRQVCSPLCTEIIQIDSDAEKMIICGYVFSFLQQLNPKCDDSGQIIKYCPQGHYANKKGLPLSEHGEGIFCRFAINADVWPGVYLWVVDRLIIYIGETANLRRRFNTGYGNISPRNCYIGGQSTNCKMNKVVLDMYEEGKVISLYFCETADYKRIELDLLSKISTPYNAKS